MIATKQHIATNAALTLCRWCTSELGLDLVVFQELISWISRKCSTQLTTTFLLHNYKLTSIGLSDDTVNWFQSYLANRKQRTSVGQWFSDLLCSETKQKQILKNALRFQRQHQATSDHVKSQVTANCFPFDVIAFAMLPVRGIRREQFHC